jgi:vacuolar-type H+-ATPase subunit I/STV1
MANEDVLAHLRELHEQLGNLNAELEKTDDIDPETIDALGLLLNDVGSLFDQAKTIQDQEQVERQQDLQDRIVQLETSHPVVTSFLSRLTDVLAMMGI